MRKFECQRCGDCCSNLLGTTDGKAHGIYLTPEEANFFPVESVFPLFRNGDYVFAYQTGPNKCPNLTEDNGLFGCRIYKDRPLVCKSFPVGYGDNDKPVVLFNICTFTAKHRDDDWDMTSFASGFRAAREQAEQYAVNPKATEMFVLNEMRWVSLES